MNFRAMLLIICAGLLAGSAFLVLEASDLPGAVGAAVRGEPLRLPEGLVVGSAAFFAVFSIVAGALLWRTAGRADQHAKASAERIGAELARFQREARTRDKTRRAEVMRARTQWEKEQKAQAPDRAGRQWAGWGGPLLAALVAGGIAAGWAPRVFPHWLGTRGYEPCEALDETRWVRTRHGRREVQQFGWALPRDCPAARE